MYLPKARIFQAIEFVPSKFVDGSFKEKKIRSAIVLYVS